MKKILFILCFFSVVFAGNSNASNADLFSINENIIYAELAEISQVEELVNNNSGITFSELKSNENFLSLNVNPNFYNSLQEGTGPALGIPSFIWGCCLGWVGILITHLVTEDKEETKKALYGCIVGGAVGMVAYIVYVAAIVAATSGI